MNTVLVERYAYDVFGRPTIRDANGTEVETSACGNPYLFTGRAWDAETALYYYRARYYDYATARFLQPDPSGYADGINWYLYCGNNPANMIDPSGLDYTGLGPGVNEIEPAFERLAQTRIGEKVVKFLKDPSTGPFVIVTNDTCLSDPVTGIIVSTSFVGRRYMKSENGGVVIGYGGTIYWNPYMGCETANGELTSPTTLLGNELIHAFLWGRRNVFQSEEQVIRLERAFAQAFGESPRTTHNGFPYPTVAPGSTEADWLRVIIPQLLDPFWAMRPYLCKASN